MDIRSSPLIIRQYTQKKYQKNDIRSLSRETENIIDPEEGTRILIEK